MYKQPPAHTQMDFSQEKQTIKTSGLFAIKINVSVLKEKQWTIENVTEALGINKKEHVIGLDTLLSEKGQPHYHIHWSDDRSIGALKQVKKRAMPRWGKTTKLFEADYKKDSDKYCWYGYAIKEEQIYVSPELDMEQLGKHAHTQREIKKSKLNYAAKQAKKEKEKMTLEERVFESVEKYFEDHPFMELGFRQIAVQIAQQYYLETSDPIRKNNLQHMTYKYLISHGIWKIEDYVTALFSNY